MRAALPADAPSSIRRVAKDAAWMKFFTWKNKRKSDGECDAHDGEGLGVYFGVLGARMIRDTQVTHKMYMRADGRIIFLSQCL
jgi:hypothetical protein